MSKVFLDTNVPVLAHDKAAPAKQKHAVELLRGVTRWHEVYVSTQVLQEFYNTLTKKLDVDKRVARREMELLSNLHVVVTDLPIVVAATVLHESASLSFWDAMIVAAAQEARCDQLWTEDMQDGRKFGSLQIVNPFNTVNAPLLGF